MSGTSLDGVDVAVVDIEGRGWRKQVAVRAFGSVPYPERVRRAILSVSNAPCHTAEISRLNFLLGEIYARAVLRICRQGRVPVNSLQLVASHGQTIFHEGEAVRFLGHKVASTLQIGEAAIIAERTGVPVIADFRPRDIAAGGRGAPLVPSVDYLLVRDRRRGRVALNLGGIANITAIPAGASPCDVVAFDTGPGNMVIDALAGLHSGGRLRFDRDGKLAARGSVNRAILFELLADPYYRRKPPKTAGREQYGKEFVERLRATRLPMLDLIATATALTAAAVAEGIRRFVQTYTKIDDLIVSGGGARNPQILGYLAAFLPGVAIATSADYGIDTDAKEAIAFAILGYETWRRRPGNLPAATGARKAVVLGKLSL